MKEIYCVLSVLRYINLPKIPMCFCKTTNYVLKVNIFLNNIKNVVKHTLTTTPSLNVEHLSLLKRIILNGSSSILN